MDDKQANTSGKAQYEVNAEPPSETTSSVEPEFQDKTVIAYEAADIEKYGINKPTREIIYANIVKQERQPICTSSEETRTTE